MHARPSPPLTHTHTHPTPAHNTYLRSPAQDTMEEKLSTTNFELATCTPAAGFRLVPAAELQPLITTALAESAAEAAL